MANRLTEDEKNERIIRGLLKLSDNRRCINCNSLGPQYVCSNFWTFICTNCSGIHREFTHRVKSVSMAKFTSQEVKALQEGGNQRAKEIYLKEWDPQRHSLPDTSNVGRLRDHIKHVYVDRRYTGERDYDRPPRGKMGDKEGSRSPPFEDTRSSSGGRSPGYEQESRHYGEYKRSPSRPQIVNDWRRDDRFGNGRRFEDRMSSDGDNKSEGQSPEQPKDLDSSSPPVVRPVRDILGDNVVPLRISEPPKANGGRIADGLTHTKRASSSSLGSTSGNPAESKLESTGSLIDFNAEAEPPVPSSVSQAQTVSHSVTEPAKAVNDDNWASFDFASESKAPQLPPNANTLDSLLSQLSTPAPLPGQILGNQGDSNAFRATSWGSMASLTAPEVLSVPFSANVSASSFTSNAGPITSGKFADANQWRNMQQPANHSLEQHSTPISGVASNNQAWNMAFAPITQGPSNGPVLHASQVVSSPVLQTTMGVATQSSASEVKPSGRKELPQDLFTASFTPFPSLVPAWQMVPPNHMVAPMQYNTPVLVPHALQSSKSANPFDVGGETHSAQAPTFPSMSSLQGALPNALPPSATLMPTPTPTPAWMPPQPGPYGLALPQQVVSQPLAMAPRANFGQLSNNMSFTGYQGVGGFATESAAVGPTSPDQQLASRVPTPVAPSPFSSAGGNPFG